MERGSPPPPPLSPQKMGRGLHYCSYTGTCIYCYSFNCFHQSTDCTNSVRLHDSVIVTYNKWRNWLFFQYENCTSIFSIYKDNFRNWRTRKCSFTYIYKQQSDLLMVLKGLNVYSDHSRKFTIWHDLRCFLFYFWGGGSMLATFILLWTHQTNCYIFM